MSTSTEGHYTHLAGQAPLSSSASSLGHSQQEGAGADQDYRYGANIKTEETEVKCEHDELLVHDEESEGVDYNKIYESLQEQFNKAYSLSQKLFVTEKTQRQTLYFYKRRNNALLDFLYELEGEEDNLETPLNIDQTRIANLINFKPELHAQLLPIMQMLTNTDPNQIRLKLNLSVDLATDELIPELPNDDLHTIETNPQDTEMWTRRNYSHLVISKFKPAEIRGKGVREYIDSPTLNNKRRKRAKEP